MCEAIASGKLAAKAVLGMPYKKDLKRVYKKYKLGIPVGTNFFRDLMEIKGSPNSGRITKRLHSSRLGHLALSYIAKISAKSYKYAPSVFLMYTYYCVHYAPTVLDSYEVAKKYVESGYRRDIDYAYRKKTKDWQKDMDYTPKFF